MEEKEQFGLLTVYRERGRFLRQREMLDPALESYNIAATAYPEDISTLLGISRVCSDALRPKDAMQYAQKALDLEPYNPSAKFMQAQAMYFMSEFEKSLVMDYRGLKVRKQPPYFSEGVNTATETVQDCVGVNAGPVMLDFLPLIKRVESKRVAEEDEHIGPIRVSRIPPPLAKVKISPATVQKRASLARVMSMKYLGRMATDKFFFKERQIDKRLTSANSKGSVLLKNYTIQAYDSLAERQELLRTRKPYYHIKFAEAKPTKGMKREMENRLFSEHDASSKLAGKLLAACEKASSDGDIAKLCRLTTRTQTFLNMKTKAQLPEKDALAEKLYRVFAKGYLNQYRLTYHLGDEVNERRIKVLMGMECGRVKKFDPVLAMRLRRLGEIPEQAIEVRSIINDFRLSQARCYWLHELASLLVMLKEYARAKYYAKCCMREADELCSTDWWFLASYVLMSVDLQQGNLNEVRLTAEEAECKAYTIPDHDQIISFLKACMKIAVATAGGGDEKKAIMKRQKEILSVMEEDERVLLQQVFKNAWSLPPGRRFSVVPKKAAGVQEPPERRRRLQPGLTVVPGAPRALPAPPSSSVPGFQIFDI